MLEDLVGQAEFQRIAPDGAAATTFTLAAGTTDKTSAAIDTLGYERITLLAGFGTMTSGAVTTLKLQQCDTADGTPVDLEGTSQTVADTDDDKIRTIEIKNPRKRYLFVAWDRGTQNAVIDFLIAIKRGGRKKPVTQGATVAGGEVFSSPAEGTA
jgi:hypothetical protein